MKRHQSKENKFESVCAGNVVVKIYHRTTKGGKYHTWEVVDRSSGTRLLRSFSNHDKAIAEANRIARLISTGESHAARITGKDAASFGRALELLRPTGQAIEFAAANYAKAFEILGSDRIVQAAQDFARRNPSTRQARTVRQVADELIELKARRGAGVRYLEDLRSRLAALATRFAVNVDTVTTADVQAWLDSMKAAPRSVKNCRSAASLLFQFAESRGYIVRGENPVSATESLPKAKGKAITIYSPSELAALIGAAPDGFKPLLALQAFAGIRSAELTRLDWSNVKLAKGHIEVAANQAKTAARRLVPITDNLRQWLAPHALATGKVWPHGRPYFHETQARIAADAKLTWKHNALRHSFVSYRVAAIQNVAQVALEAGNSPQMIFSNYREIVTSAEAVQWFAIAPQSPANVVPLSQAVA
jgi:integrase